MLDVSDFAAIPDPTQDVASLQFSLQRAKENIEILTGQRGDPNDSLITTIGNLSKETANAHATIKNNFETFVDANKAIAQSTFSMEANFTTQISNANARITDVITAYADADQAILTRTNVLEVNYNNLSSDVSFNTARLTDEIIVRANQDSALAFRSTLLEAEITTARGGTGNLSARFSQVDQARVAGDQAVALSVTNLTTTVNGNTASINVHTSSINGINVQWAVQGFLGGSTGGLNFTGVRQIGGGATFLFEVTANMVIHGNLVVDGTITHNEIFPGSATLAGFTAGFTSTYVGLTTRGGVVAIEAFRAPDTSPTVISSTGFSPPVQAAGEFILYRDSVEIARISLNSNDFYVYGSFFSNTFGQVSYQVTYYKQILGTPMISLVQPAAGFHTFQAYSPTGGIVYIKATELLR